jgi:ADP-ribose pyrophosphatase YjhB (NUDIX family)
MIKLSANVAILQSERILIAKREDFEVWCIPGAMVARRESIAQAALREAREETGLEVEHLRLVGAYSRLGDDVELHEILFSVRPTGGTLRAQLGEVLELRYFRPDALPETMFRWHRQQVADACRGVGGSAAWLQEAGAAKGGDSRHELYSLRDLSGLSRPEFYSRHLEPRRIGESLEVGAISSGE